MSDPYSCKDGKSDAHILEHWSMVSITTNNIMLNEENHVLTTLHSFSWCPLKEFKSGLTS